ncbi:MAG: sulfatase-like hydrolase/transferase, partial [Acidimicrobiales bacterium]
MTQPRDVVVVLLDSLNRHLIGAYGGREFDTPNLDRLAARSVRFTNHHTGSLPCMPARHDLLVGALDFPWRPWGSIEVWEDAITTLLRHKEGVSTFLASDHPHLFETGGENYHTDFGAWDYLRGHEDDPWRTRPDPTWIGAPALPARKPPWERGYDVSRTWFKDEADFPGPKTMTAAAAWLDAELSA